jgi:hypothetical protein
VNIAVQFEHVGAPGSLMQAVHVLGDESKSRNQLCHQRDRAMSWIRLRALLGRGAMRTIARPASDRAGMPLE